MLLPEETVRTIMAQPPEDIWDVPLGKTGEEFFSAYILNVFGYSIRLNPLEKAKKAIPMIKTIVATSGELREQFDSCRARTVEEWRQEFEERNSDLPRFLEKEDDSSLNEMIELLNSI